MIRTATISEAYRQLYADTPKVLPSKPDWPLIGDILTVRLDEPDLLRLWTKRAARDERMVRHPLRR